MIARPLVAALALLGLAGVGTGLHLRSPPTPTPAPQAAKAVVGRYTLQDAGKTVLDRVTGLRWQQGYSATKMIWSDAKVWCGDNPPALPASGWRLPTARELATLIDSQAQKPAIDAVFGVPNGAFFWSATKWIGGGAGWYVEFDDGQSHFLMCSENAGSGRVRCVR